MSATSTLTPSQCSALAATSPTPSTPMYANPDIIGSVMLAAFFATATTAVVAVDFAYLSQAIDEIRLNFLDQKVIAIAQRCWYGTFKGRRDSMTSIARWLDLTQVRNIRTEGILQFILSLSDQQLVTGLAILIAGICGQGQHGYNRYEFVTIHNLAWFASTTHLATLDAIRHHIDSHRIVRNARTAGILLFVLLLTYAFIIRVRAAMLGPGWSFPVHCVFVVGMRHISPTCPPVREPHGNWCGTFNIFWQCAWTITLLLILFGYLTRIQDFYTHQRHPLYCINWLIWRISQRKSDSLSYSQIYDERKAVLRLRRLFRLSTTRGFRQFSSQAYDDSFLSSIPTIAFSFSYAVSQVVAVRYGMHFDFLSKSNPWGYGPIASLLLLCLPFMSAGEAISNFQQKRNEQLVERMRQIVEDAARTSSSISEQSYNIAHELNSLSRGNTHVNDDLADVNTRYGRNLVPMSKYFCKEVHDIAEKESKDNLEISQRKQSVLTMYEVVKQLEQHIYIRWYIAWFLLNVSAAIALGALLNAGNFDGPQDPDVKIRIAVAIGIFLVFIVTKTVSLLSNTVAMLRSGDWLEERGMLESFAS